MVNIFPRKIIEEILENNEVKASGDTIELNSLDPQMINYKLNSRIYAMNLAPSTYKKIVDAYKEHIIGDARPNNKIPKKRDNNSFYRNLNKLTNLLSEKEINALVKHDKNYSINAGMILVSILEKTEEGTQLLEKIIELERDLTERWHNHSYNNSYKESH